MALAPAMFRRQYQISSVSIHTPERQKSSILHDQYKMMYYLFVQGIKARNQLILNSTITSAEISDMKHQIACDDFLENAPFQLRSRKKTR